MRATAVKLVLTGVLMTLGLAVTGVQAREKATDGVEATVPLGHLPQQGQETYRRIHEGGPFAFEKDGVVFGNRERLLPASKRGHYREYTVITPGIHHRGMRRIVCGGPKTAPEACYYTADHYVSFRRILP